MIDFGLSMKFGEITEKCLFNPYTFVGGTPIYTPPQLLGKNFIQEFGLKNPPKRDCEFAPYHMDMYALGFSLNKEFFNQENGLYNTGDVDQSHRAKVVKKFIKYMTKIPKNRSNRWNNLINEFRSNANGSGNIER